MKENKVTHKIGIWLQNFLVGRKQHIVVGNEMSKPSNVISGIPQGTVLARISTDSDIDKDVENIASMFADDTQLMGRIREEPDVEVNGNRLNFTSRRGCFILVNSSLVIPVIMPPFWGQFLTP